MPSLKELEEGWAADLALRQIPVQPRLPYLKGGTPVGTISYNEKTQTMEISFFHDQKPKEENPPQVGG
jgi:hypothetical protein